MISASVKAPVFTAGAAARISHLEPQRMSALDLYPPEPFEALIFDCDGTLADTASIHFEGLRSGFSEAGVDFTEAWYLERVGLSRAEFFEEVRRTFDVDVDEQRIVDAHDRHFQAHVDTIGVIEAVAEVAHTYAGRVPMAVASGGRRRQVEATLDATGLHPLFGVVVTMEDVERGKPAPDLFHEAARRLGVEPASCVVYEDSREGVEAAHRAGMRVIHVRSA